MAETLRVRRSLYDLQKAYENGDKKPLEDLMRAFVGIKAKDYKDPTSFFQIAGYHGEPFDDDVAEKTGYWGGWCQHQNVLFPTWHRVLVIKLEESLRSVPGCGDVNLPYLDITADDFLKFGLPWPLTRQTFELDGVPIPNPLTSYILPIALTDNAKGDNPNEAKPQGYETKRYPQAGLRATPKDRDDSDKHNKDYPDPEKNVEYLNEYLKNWVDPTAKKGIYKLLKKCLSTKCYVPFSNRQSSGFTKDPKLVTLEQPHDAVHLAIGGGFQTPNSKPYILGANGDMNNNDVAAFDPIFFFHHCNIDRIFWLWQQIHGETEKITFEAHPKDPGTIAGIIYDSQGRETGQGPSRGQTFNQKLNLNTELKPFKKSDGKYYTSMDIVDIEKQCGYKYTDGSFSGTINKKEKIVKAGDDLKASILPDKSLVVTNINKAVIPGSFQVKASLRTKDDIHLLGIESILSRNNLQNCENCKLHLNETVQFKIPKDLPVDDATPEIEILPADTFKHVTGTQKFKDMLANIQVSIQ